MKDALAAFAGWHPQVQAIIGAVDETFIWALFARPPDFRTRSDYAAAQGLEDGATLTACLERDAPDVLRALERYEQLRLPRATRIQAMSAENKIRFQINLAAAKSAGLKFSSKLLTLAQIVEGDGATAGGN